MSLLRRLWRTITGRTHLVGRDLEGNRFYEYPSPNDDPRRTKRVVKYKRVVDYYDAASQGRRLPVQWMMWLSHARGHAPTTGELRADLARQQRVIANVAIIEQRERDRQARIAVEPPQQFAFAQRSPSQDVPIETAQTQLGSNSGDPGLANSAPGDGSSHQPESTPQYSDEPQAWSPRAVRRNGG